MGVVGWVRLNSPPNVTLEKVEEIKVSPFFLSKVPLREEKKVTQGDDGEHHHFYLQKKRLLLDMGSRVCVGVCVPKSNSAFTNSRTTQTSVARF